VQEIDFTRCRTATTRAYRELRQRGVQDPRAFTAAMKVFGYHCPSLHREAARNLVAAWVDSELNPVA